MGIPTLLELALEVADTLLMCDREREHLVQLAREVACLLVELCHPAVVLGSNSLQFLGALLMIDGRVLRILQRDP